MPKKNFADRILKAGQETLFQKGFHGTSVQDITDAAGVPKGSFYNHFDSKEALGAQAVLAYAAMAATKLAALDDKSVPPLARLKTYFDSMNQLPIDDAFQRGCMLGNFGAELSSHSETIRGNVDAAMQEWSHALAQVIGEAQQSGEVAAGLDALVLANFLINAWEGAVLRAKIVKNREPLDAFSTLAFTKILC